MRVPALATVAIVLLSTPSTADSPTPDIVFPGEGWALIEVTPTASNSFVFLDWDCENDTTTAALFLIRKRDGFLYPPTVGSSPAPGVLDVAAFGEEVVEVGRLPIVTVGCVVGGSVGYAMEFGESYWVVMLAGGDVKSWTYRFTNASWTQLDSGDVHAFEPSDFEPVGVEARLLGASAFAAVGTRTINVEYELFGLGSYELVPTGLRVTDPDGSLRICPCRFPPGNTPANISGPGDYTFELNPAGVRVIPGTLVVVADVPIPRG